MISWKRIRGTLASIALSILALATLALMGGAGCAPVTGVRVAVVHDGLDIDAVDITGALDPRADDEDDDDEDDDAGVGGRAEAFAPSRLPEEPRPLGTGESFVVYVDDGLDGERLRIWLLAWRGDELVAWGDDAARLERGAMADATVRLRPARDLDGDGDVDVDDATARTTLSVSDPGPSGPGADPPAPLPDGGGPSDGCGDGVLDAGEACDGAALGALTCLAAGHLPGAGPACDATCGAVDVASCGAPIDDEDALALALAAAAARPGRDVVAVRAPTLTLTAPVRVEAGDVELRPLTTTSIAAPADGPAFLVLADDVAIVGFAVTGDAVSADADDLHLFALRVDARRHGIVIDGDGARVQRTFVTATDGDTGISIRRAVHARVAETIVAGRFRRGLRLDDVGRADLEQSSLLADAHDGSLAVKRSAVCARNNVIATARVDDGADACGSERNALLGECAGACAPLCARDDDGDSESSAAGADGLCDVDASPAFTGDGTCPRASSGLVDSGLDLGLDLDDGTGLWVGAAPDLGARERGGTRTFGGAAHTCPAE